MNRFQLNELTWIDHRLPCFRGSGWYATIFSSVNRSVVFIAALVLFGACAFSAPDWGGPFLSYTIQPGDTLYRVAQRYGSTPEELAQLNEVEPTKLQIGSELVVPDRGVNRNRPASRSVPRRAPNARVKVGDAGALHGRMSWPVPKQAVKISSKFGRRWLKFHDGVDLSGASGTPIYAAHSGRVVFSGTGLSGYGKTIVIKGHGLLTVYAHNRRNLVDLGDDVRVGEQIAEIGMSGNASGPHLHFEVRVPSQEGRFVAVDPLGFLK